MESKTIGKERVFSVELKSKRNLKNVTLTNGSSDGVLVEGTIGELVQAQFGARGVEIVEHRQQVGLGQQHEIGGAEHHRIFRRFVVALRDRQHSYLAPLAQFKSRWANQVPNVLYENQIQVADR